MTCLKARTPTAVPTLGIQFVFQTGYIFKFGARNGVDIQWDAKEVVACAIILEHYIRNEIILFINTCSAKEMFPCKILDRRATDGGS